MNTKKTRSILAITTAGLAVVAVAAPMAIGATYTWDGSVDSDWDDLGNWTVDGMTPGALPGAGDDVVIASVGAFQSAPVLNVDATINSLDVQSGGTLRFEQSTARILTVDNGNVTISGTLNVDNGGTFDVQSGSVSVSGRLDLDDGSADLASTLSVSGIFEATNSSVIDVGGATTVNTADFDMTSSQFDAGGLFTVNTSAVVDLVSSTLNIEASNGLDLDAASSEINLSGTNPSLVIKTNGGAAFPIDGPITLNSSTALLDVQQSSTFMGSGSIVGQDDAAKVEISAGRTFVSEITVQGRMQVNAGASGAFHNRHEVIADQSGGTLEFTSSTVVDDDSSAVFKAIDGGRLLFSRDTQPLEGDFLVDITGSVLEMDEGVNVVTCGELTFNAGQIAIGTSGATFEYQHWNAMSSCANPADDGDGSSCDPDDRWVVNTTESCM